MDTLPLHMHRRLRSAAPRELRERSQFPIVSRWPRLIDSDTDYDVTKRRPRGVLPTAWLLQQALCVPNRFASLRSSSLDQNGHYAAQPAEFGPQRARI